MEYDATERVTHRCDVRKHFRANQSERLGPRLDLGMATGRSAQIANAMLFLASRSIAT